MNWGSGIASPWSQPGGGVIYLYNDHHQGQGEPASNAQAIAAHSILSGRPVMGAQPRRRFRLEHRADLHRSQVLDWRDAIAYPHDGFIFTVRALAYGARQLVK